MPHVVASLYRSGAIGSPGIQAIGTYGIALSLPNAVKGPSQCSLASRAFSLASVDSICPTLLLPPPSLALHLPPPSPERSDRFPLALHLPDVSYPSRLLSSRPVSSCGNRLIPVPFKFSYEISFFVSSRFIFGWAIFSLSIPTVFGFWIIFSISFPMSTTNRCCIDDRRSNSSGGRSSTREWRSSMREWRTSTLATGALSNQRSCLSPEARSPL